MNDTTTLITGASSGIGAEFARQLSAQGRHVTLVARREDRLRELADEIGDAEVVPCDLTDPGAVAALPGRIGRHVDYLVSNAGFGTGGPFVKLDLDQEIRQVRLLCEANVHLCGLFVPPMVERGEGTVVVIASTAGFQPMPYSAGYSAAKSHALTFSEALHEECRGRGVHVTAVCPGPVATEFFDNGHPAQRMPGPMWVSTEKVVSDAISGAASNKRVVVPGLLVRAGMTGGRFTPRWLTNRAIGLMFR